MRFTKLKLLESFIFALWIILDEDSSHITEMTILGLLREIEDE